MKRIIAFLLSAMLVASMMSVSATAFTDSPQIGDPYRAAVSAVSEAGVINGFPDGSFLPENPLTREQAAKIVTFMLLGETEAAALVCADSPYTDVETSRWSAPAIRYCTEQNILHGMGDGTYKPTSLLTGPQFAKMLLCAYKLGDSSKYVGDAWMENVVEDGMKAGLFEGDLSMSADKALQRQQAALMAWNAIKTTAPSGISGESGSTTSSGESGSSSGSSTSSGESGGTSGSSSTGNPRIDFNPGEWFTPPSEGDSTVSPDVPNEQPPEEPGTQPGPGSSTDNTPDGPGESGGEGGGTNELPFVPFDGVITLPEIP